MATQNICMNNQSAFTIRDDHIFKLDARSWQHGKGRFAFSCCAQTRRLHDLFGQLLAQRVSRQSPMRARHPRNSEGEG